ncbi:MULTISPECIES: 2'-5' RNA ligase family protein [unclassified Amycolatopsis]|uniref:2'-5' RNA ligase family protein n=1 Tax=unclassified Amycolatopsis TaxID=2618356 RepID=UPI002E0E2118|nr:MULTISPECIES: 2'-5' RNA ligase family protein [unclassified Amycolatopsis]WSJ78165.1 2'-5' RNA ligase family protein [Amycolatopsis sp. NBC_01307]WSK78274.1 2'-5' RNA ligase family protein [Amycolatopsis sp. NBC_01286]
MPAAEPPLVVTLAVDRESQQAWDELRRTWFPAERLKVGAHVTLFHALPGEHADAVIADCAEIAARCPRFSFSVDGVYSLGGGVAIALSAAALTSLHGKLRTRWRSWLTAQDAQPLKPHVTVQNKVSRETARATIEALRPDFGPRTGSATGLAVWRYLGGPWQPVTSVDFVTPAVRRAGE